jgi:hypothetical protein
MADGVEPTFEEKLPAAFIGQKWLAEMPPYLPNPKSGVTLPSRLETLV